MSTSDLDILEKEEMYEEQQEKEAQKLSKNTGMDLMDAKQKIYDSNELNLDPEIDPYDQE